MEESQFLRDWQNADVLPWPTHAHLDLASYFSQTPSHRTSLSLAHKKMFPSPHAFHEANSIKPAVLFLEFRD